MKNLLLIITCLSTLCFALLPTTINAQSVNLALHKPAHASSATSTRVPDSAFDGNATTRWESAATDPQWIYVDLGTSYPISGVKLTWQAAYGKDYQIQISEDAQTWITIKTIIGNTQLINNFTGLSGTGRYVRMDGTARGTSGGFSLYEFEVYSYPNPPIVHITSPGNNATFTTTSSINVTASAIPDGIKTITRVEFYYGSTLLATDATLPYSFAWNNVNVGAYTITAKAFDNASAVSVSSPIHITVNRIASGACGTAPAWNNGTVYSTAGMQVLYDGRLYENMWYSQGQNPEQNSGQYEIWKLLSTCETGTTVTITTPDNNASFHALASINIHVDAITNQGFRIRKVDLYNGATLIDSDTSSSFAFNWNDVAAGSYSLTAVATDNVGVTTTSAAVAITVVAGTGCDAPAWRTSTIYSSTGEQVTYAGSLYQNKYYTQGQNPAANSGQYQVWTLVNTCPTTTTVNITSPGDSELYMAPATIPIAATASTSSGTITKVEFYRGLALLSSVTSAPYTYSWQGVAAGTYEISAKAYNNTGAVTVSSAIHITVLPAGSTYTWTGNGGTSDWNTTTNWSPNGIPGVHDSVVVVTATHSPRLANNTAVDDITMSSGALDLNNEQLTIAGFAVFNGGTISNGNLNMPSVETRFAGTVFGANAIVNATSGNIYFNGSVFNGPATITKTGVSGIDNIGTGNNIFNAPVTITNNSTRLLRMGSSAVNNFNSDATFINHNSGALDISYNSNSTFAGNITVNSNSAIGFAVGSGTVILNGSNHQSINKTGLADVTFNRLTVNKPANAVTLNTPVSIGSILTFTQGNIISSTGNELIFNSGATVSGVSGASFAAGPVTRFGVGLFTFPIGKNASYRPISIAPHGVATDAFMAEYFPTASSFDHTAKDPVINHISECEHWILNRTAGNTPGIATLSWDENSCGVTRLADLLVARWNGSQWMNHGNGNTTGSNTAGTIATSSDVMAFSPFALASGTFQNPLPVKLISFKATAQPTRVLVQWVTADEYQNESFEVQRSTNGDNFETHIFVKGAGNSTVVNNYSVYDDSPLNGLSFYRLKQTDINGRVIYSSTVSVRFETPGSVIRITPNPVFNNATLSIRLSTPDICAIEIVDATGRVVYRKKAGITSSANITIDFSRYTKGIYFIAVKTPHKILYREKIIKN